MLAKYLQKIHAETKIATKIIVMIILISFVGIVASSMVIERFLQAQIMANVKHDVESMGDKLLISVKSRYRTFFFDTAHKKDIFDKANLAAQRETLNDLRQLYSDKRDHIFIVTPTSVYPISTENRDNAHLTDEYLSNVTYRHAMVAIEDDHFVYARKFLPWQWTIVLMREKQVYADIVNHNKLVVISSISGLILFILISLMILLRFVIMKPANAMFDHMQKIAEGNYQKLDLKSSYETRYLSQMINMMSERVQNREKQLKFEKNKSRKILDLQHDIVILNDGNEMIDVNHSFFKFFDKYSDLESFKKEHGCICDFFVNRPGYLRKEMEGTNWVEYVLGDPERTHQAIIVKDDREFVFNVNVSKSAFEDKDLYIVSFNDVTELEMYRMTLEQRMHEAIEKNRQTDLILNRQSKTSQMGEMLSMIAHQWRQPLNAISASAIALTMKHELDSLSSDDITTHADFVQQQTQRMSKTINDFMNFFKPEKEKNSFTMNEIMEDIRSLMDVQLRSRNIELVCHGSGAIPIYSYEKELAHVLINLIANSRDAYESHPAENQTIDLAATIENEHVTISVADHAGGIPPEHIDAVFDPYFTTKEQGKGTGIGLYMSRRIVQEVLQGEIRVNNQDDGVCFDITIPNKDAGIGK